MSEFWKNQRLHFNFGSFLCYSFISSYNNKVFADMIAVFDNKPHIKPWFKCAHIYTCSIGAECASLSCKCLLHLQRLTNTSYWPLTDCDQPVPDQCVLSFIVHPSLFSSLKPPFIRHWPSLCAPASSRSGQRKAEKAQLLFTSFEKPRCIPGWCDFQWQVLLRQSSYSMSH